MKNPAPISYRYCPLIQESVAICQSPLLMGEKIAFENGQISDFQGLVTLTLDRVILHTVMHHSSTSTYVPNFIKTEETLCGWTDGRTFEIQLQLTN